jgi:putative DNA methylase
VITYLGLGVSKLTDYNCSNVTWSKSRDQAAHAFTKQSIPMVWDYAEVNPLAGAAGDLTVSLKGIAEVLEKSVPASIDGFGFQADATVDTGNNVPYILISTDPPYFDSIGYSDLSDFFYVWLRRSLNCIYPRLFDTLLTPKAQELVANPYRFGGSKKKAEIFFQEGLSKAFARIRNATIADYPFSVYYAVKQSEDDEEKGSRVTAVASTGWETMLEGLIQGGFSINGTWPIRTERSVRSLAIDTNALASSIVLVCRPRLETAPSATRRQFVTALKRELPDALQKLQQGNIAPVDLAQASIGPGMAIYSRYNKVLESDGTPMRVRTALQLINQMLDEYLAEQESEFDAETKFALIWFEQYTFKDGLFGEAETLSKAKIHPYKGW